MGKSAKFKIQNVPYGGLRVCVLVVRLINDHHHNWLVTDYTQTYLPQNFLNKRIDSRFRIARY